MFFQHPYCAPEFSWLMMLAIPKFEISLYSDAREKEPVRELVRSAILPQLRKALGKFSGDLIAEHGKDIQHAPGSGPGTPAPAIPAAKVTTAAKPSSSSSSAPVAKGVVNTLTLSDTAVSDHR